MKIHVLSDLHLEFADFELPEVEADVVVLAGDIAQGVNGIRWAMDAFKAPVFYVPGNHEYYGHEFNMKDLAPFNRQQVIIKGVRFLGTTLWTDFNLYGDVDKAMNSAEDKMYDYRAIRVRDRAVGARALNADEVLNEHVTCVKWLRAKLDEPFDGKTVVVTHHSPSPHSVHERYGRMSLNASFSSNLLDLVEKADVWIHGHAHDSFDYKFKDCRVVCNPRGYPVGASQENRGFDPAKVIEL